MGITYKISTLGCKVNQQESETLAADFRALGFEPTRKGEAADVCVINSCTVTSIADSKTRQRVRQARATNPEALICVVGCLPETSRDAVLSMPEVDLAIGSLEKERTAEIVAKALKQRYPAHPGDSLRFVGGEKDKSTEITRLRAEGQLQQRTRAMIKIEDGCDRFCAYCIVPYARGAVRCKPADEVVSEAEKLLKAGYKEIILTGVNLARYGDLYDLVKRVCGIDAEGEFRVRLGSLEPTLIDADEAARIAEIPGVCPQFHLSLQSGAKRTLMEMGRPYTPEGYLEIVRKLRLIDPLFSITTDVIVGFPGEDESDFEESLEFVKSIGFAHVHVFKYSKRPGTRAAEMPGQVNDTVKNERSRLMIEAAEEGAERFVNLNKDIVRRTLIFGPDKSGKYIRGITDNGIDILLKAGNVNYDPNSFADLVL